MTLSGFGRIYLVVGLVLIGLLLWMAFRSQELFEKHFEVPKRESSRTHRPKAKPSDPLDAKSFALGDIVLRYDRRLETKPDFFLPVVKIKGNGVMVSKVDWQDLSLNYESRQVSRRYLAALLPQLKLASSKITKTSAALDSEWTLTILNERILPTPPAMEVAGILKEILANNKARPYRVHAVSLLIVKGRIDAPLTSWPLIRPSLKRVVSSSLLRVTRPEALKALQSKLPATAVYASKKSWRVRGVKKTWRVRTQVEIFAGEGP
ncbi:MAG: hypothetical protein V3W41_16475 [Planctomycetota bacterium]